VLQEYFAAATRRLGLPAEAARNRVEALGRLDVVILTADDVLAAIDLHRRHSLSIWDALIVRAALVSGCRTLFSEDLQTGRRFGALEIVNPFA
jgi:predicted nucleic acid-binding protein